MWPPVLLNNGIVRLYGFFHHLVQSPHFADQETEAEREGTHPESLSLSVTDNIGTCGKLYDLFGFLFPSL